MASQINASNSGFGGVVTSGDSSGILQLQTAGTPALTIDTSQNVGIGTASPVRKLDVVVANAEVARFYGTNKSIDGTGNLQVFTSNSQSTNNGGTIGIGGMNGSAGAFDPWAFATLKGAKENSTSSNLAGYLAIATSSSGGTISERMRIDSSGNLLFNSGYGSVATAYGCRAWVNFSGATPTVNASGNVSSVTKQSTGNYTINFTNSMPDTNYAVCGTAYSISVAAGVLGVNTPSTGNCTIQTVNSTNAAGADFTKVSVAIFR